MTTKDYSKYRYENLEGRPNVLIGYHLGQTYTSVKFQHLLLETARIMFKKAPKNTYIFTGPQSSNEVANMYRCTVERDGEVLGILAYAQGRNGTSVLVDNERIRKERDRGGGMVTSDVKRASALALKKFLPTTNEEALLQSYGKMGETLRNMVSHANARKQSVLSSQATRVLAYIDTNWLSEGVALLEKIGLPKADIEETGATIVAQRKFTSLRQRFDFGLTFVLQKGDTLYAVPLKLSNYGNPELTQRAYSWDDAPSDMRLQLGRLKVAEVDTYIPDCGYRIGDDSFAIFFDMNTPLPKEEDDEDDA